MLKALQKRMEVVSSSNLLSRSSGAEEHWVSVLCHLVKTGRWRSRWQFICIPRRHAAEACTGDASKGAKRRQSNRASLNRISISACRLQQNAQHTYRE